MQTSESLEVLSNGWAIDTTAPVDLTPSDNDVSAPLRTCLSSDSDVLVVVDLCRPITG